MTDIRGSAVYVTLEVALESNDLQLYHLIYSNTSYPKLMLLSCHSFIHIRLKHDDKMHHEHTSIKNSTLKVRDRPNNESNKVNIHLCTAYEQ